MDIQKIECLSSIEQREWDKLVENLGGSFFHSYAYGLRGATKPNLDALFIKVFDRAGNCVGIVVGTISTPSLWPFSRYCKHAIIAALPASLNNGAGTEIEIMRAIEEKLKQIGIFCIKVCSYDSPNSATVLSALAYKIKDRFEFYIDLSESEEDLWKKLQGERRTDIRKATRIGVKTRIEDTITGLRLLYVFQAESLRRRGVQLPSTDNQADVTKELLLDTGQAMLLISYFEGTPINAALFGIFNGRSYYLNSGSTIDGYKSCGPVHLIWTMIKLSRANGSKFLNLGGVTVPKEKASEDGLYRFKRDFGSKVIYQPAGTKVISRFGAVLNAMLLLLKSLITGHIGSNCQSKTN
jgi:hypothetical protein